ncbi:Guanylate kinase [invertebrate metagenome]|uniref:Guanylate kinase n=1 Tax=invertebrate metagenome TaxID=1711999 RepID=A0A484H7C6_9ZZZZ
MTIAIDIHPPASFPLSFCLADACGLRRRGLMLVLSSPSGAGKSTLCRALLDLNPALVLSVSMTTRSPRPGEVNGRDYHFTSMAAFQCLIATGSLLEYARIFGHYYGTLSEPVAEALAAGRDILFDIDWQGYRQLQHDAAGDVVGVFILPPSVEELECRLRRRAQDSNETIAHRMSKVSAEIAHWDEYRYVIVNRNVEHSVAAIETILETERLRRHRQIGLPALVASMQGVMD